jgi:hypothetical protein
MVILAQRREIGYGGLPCTTCYFFEFTTNDFVAVMFEDLQAVDQPTAAINNPP